MSLPHFLSSHPPPSKPATAWNSEKLYFRGDDYFRDLLRSMDRAKESIDFETYIFEPGHLGDQVAAALERAARKKVKVRVLVDGVGSPQFASYYGQRLEKVGIHYRVYRSWPAFFSTLYKRFWLLHFFRSIQRLIALFNTGERRDHRKQIIVDGRQVWAGSFNVSDWHSAKAKRKNAWRDTGIALSGIKNLAFQLAFQMAWEDPWPRALRRKHLRSLREWLSKDLERSPIRMTASRKLRRAFRRELATRIRRAQHKVWIMTPYFVPTGHLWRALIHASKKGCDVRLILPGKSDVPMVQWASRTYYSKLLRKGCRLFEYQTSVLHAKTAVMDSWGLVGSSNLDYRSLRKDLEINVIPKNRKTVTELESQFLLDQAQSREVKLEELTHYSLGTRLLSWFFYQFRYWF